LCSFAFLDFRAGILAQRAGAAGGMPCSGSRRNLPGERIGQLHQVFGVAGADHAAAELAGAGPEVDDVVRAPDGVLVVLDHHQRVALGLELLQHAQQDLVVAVVQADGRLVQDVAHAAQVGAELRGEADALRLAARKRGRRAVQRQVAQADLLQEIEAAVEFGDRGRGQFRSLPCSAFCNKGGKAFMGMPP
jgi:hypothetical protein